MATSITITTGDKQFSAQLNDTSTAAAIVAALPIKADGRRWGEEIYFSIPVEAKSAPDAREVVQAGELGYWPAGNAFCLFFGPTPASRGDEIRAASPVNIVGNLLGDYADLSDVPDGVSIEVRLSGS